MRVVVSSICAAFLNAGAATATPLDMTVDRLFSICEALRWEPGMVLGEISAHLSLM